MDQHHQRHINEAAEQFANALTQSYRVVADRSVSAQERNAQLTQDFFNRTIDNLHTQAEDNREVGQQLSEQQQRASEAAQTLTQESVNAYTDFVNSVFSFQQEATQQAQKQTQRSAKGGGRRGKKQQG
ncbi:MAG: hypothetical protein JOZ19_02495 [Rubrobacter sp.]|nr:hypothetical protein [Rubrobacter sp.]